MTQSGEDVPAFGVVSLERLAGMSGLDCLTAMIRGELPSPPMARTLGFKLEHVSEGHAVFSGTPTLDHYNPLGSVHAGFAATLLDSCMACAVHSTLPKRWGYTTMEFKISLLRPMTIETGPVQASGLLLSRGRRAATAEGRLSDRSGRLLAHATTTCLLFEI